MLLLASLSLALLAPLSGTVTITGVSDSTADGAIPLSVSVGDLDGDGVADQGTLMIRCSGGKVSAALFQHNVKSPRDAASGQASGKRTHVMPHVFETAGPRLSKVRPTYAMDGGRKGYGRWDPLTLSATDDLCPAASEEVAKVKATKSRSNIQNN